MSEGSFNAVSRKLLTPAEAAYLAAFIDGEGTLTIGRMKRPENRIGYRYTPILLMANTNRAGLERIRELCGNGRLLLCTPSKTAAHKHLFRLQFSANQIRHLLPQVEPFLLLKREQASLLAAFLRLVVNGKNTTPAQWQEMERLRAEIRALNHRGLATAREPIEAVKPRPARNPWEKREADRRGVCSVEGCGRPHGAKGYCRRHYKLYVWRGGPKVYENTCEHCGRRFINRYKGTRFCSKRCNDKRLSVRRKTRPVVP